MTYTHKLYIQGNTYNRCMRFATAQERASMFHTLRDAGWRGRMVHGQGLTLFAPETHGRVFGDRK